MTDTSAETMARGPKPSLAVSAQIAHLKSKGVAFELCSEEDAADYLRTANNLLRTSSYRKLFPVKATGAHAGEYAGLDFEHLRALSSLDRLFRACFLSIALDIEHFARIEVLNECEERNEDGYSIVQDYLRNRLNHKGRNHVEGGLRTRGSAGVTHDEYSGDLIAKHLDAGEHLDRMPVWVFLETIEFRAFTDFYLFCAERWGGRGDAAAALRAQERSGAPQRMRTQQLHTQRRRQGFEEGRQDSQQTSDRLSQRPRSDTQQIEAQ